MVSENVLVYSFVLVFSLSVIFPMLWFVYLKLVKTPTKCRDHYDKLVSWARIYASRGEAFVPYNPSKLESKLEAAWHWYKKTNQVSEAEEANYKQLVRKLITV